jgi:hypothetical protein
MTVTGLESDLTESRDLNEKEAPTTFRQSGLRPL